MPGIPIDLLQRQVKLVHIASQRPFTVTQSRCDASLQEASGLYNLQSCGMFTNSFFLLVELSCGSIFSSITGRC